MHWVKYIICKKKAGISLALTEFDRSSKYHTIIFTAKKKLGGKGRNILQWQERLVTIVTRSALSATLYEDS